MSKKTQTSTFTSWDEINLALKRLGELTMKRRTLENSLTDDLNKVKEAHATEAKPVIDEIKEIEKDIELYVVANKDQFAKVRNKKFTFGAISFHVSKSIRVLSIDTCLKALKTLGMHDFINIKETPNRDMLKTLKETELAKVACKVNTKDNLTIEPYIEEIKPEGVQK